MKSSAFPETSGKVLIDGKWVDGGKKAAVINPARINKVVGEVGLSETEHADAAIRSAASALADWSRTRPEERAERLQAAAADLRKSVPELTRLLVRENGKPTETVCESNNSVAGDGEDDM